MSRDKAEVFATTVLAAVDGAPVIARAERDIDAFDLVAEHLRVATSRCECPAETTPAHRTTTNL